MADRTGKRKPPEAVTSTLRLDDATPFQEEIAKSVRSHYRPAIVVMSGARVGQKIVLEGGNSVIGRDPDAAVWLDDAGVSWAHALVEDRGGSFAVVDLGSTNGTVVNGKKIDGDHVLAHGDKLVFGTTMVRFEVQDAADQAFDEFVSRLINVDDLTGLMLRRRFDGELRMMVTQAAAEARPLGMLVMDLDGIKKINDTHGHAFGAFTISEAGRVIGRIIGERGIACRWGGDEFLAALPGADLAATVAVGDEIVSAIRQHRFEKEGEVLEPGVSIGVAAFPTVAETAEQLFQAADEAMYRAKRAGKNRVST